MTEQSYEDWLKSAQELNANKTQESKVVPTAEELPAVSKLREAFETARNAIVDGSELAKQVETLCLSVDSLQSKVASLTWDLEYVRNRNRELDEQVVQVRRSRDEAIADASEQRSRADKAEADLKFAHEAIAQADTRNLGLGIALDDARRERDDAMSMALEYETKFKEAAGKLAAVQALFAPTQDQEPSKPVPHYLVQPRDEETKQFRPFDPNAGSQGTY